MAKRVTDKMRLDWLNKHGWDFENLQEIPEVRVYNHMAECFYGRTVRKAIDRAMRGK